MIIEKRIKEYREQSYITKSLRRRPTKDSDQTA
jgi:hypothetical protein